MTTADIQAETTPDPAEENEDAAADGWPWCDLLGYDDFADDYDDDGGWREDMRAAAEYDDDYWRAELRFQSKWNLCAVCSLYHSERVCDLWRAGDVPAVRGLLGERELVFVCHDCGEDEAGCYCDGEEFDSKLSAPADCPRPWEVLRAQLEAIGFVQIEARP